MALSDGESFLPPDFRFRAEDLAGDAEPLTLLARGDGDRLSFPAGLMEVSGRWACFRGGVLDILFIAFLGEREPEELLPEDEAERERRLRTGERRCLCLEVGGPRLGGLLRRGDILLLGLCLLRGE